MTLGVRELQRMLVSATRAKLMWSGDWIHMGSMSSTGLFSLLFQWLQVHNLHYQSFGVACFLIVEP